MKIIQVYQTNPFKDGQGGGVRYVRNLLRGIKNDCEKILFFGIGDREQHQGSIELYPIRSEMTGYIKFLLFLMLKLPFIDLSKYDVIHVHRLYFAIPFILLKPNLKIVCSLHGRTFSVFESNNGSLKLKIVKPIFMMIEKFAIKNIDYLVPVSQDVVNSFQSKYNDFSKNNIKVIGSMLQLKKFNIQTSNYLQKKFGANNKYILFIGRLADVKDIVFLINLWSKKFQNEKNIKLIIAGNGEDKEKLFNLNNKICRSNEAIFIGEIKPEIIPNLISSSNIVVLSSKHEASPTVIKESHSCGIPVVSNLIGDVDEFIIDGKNGFLVEKDYNSYFNAMKKLLDNPLFKEEVFENSKEQLKKCSVEYVSNQYIKIYKEVIND